MWSTEILPPGTRIAMGVEYDGSGYSGWQQQTKLQVPTVQSDLEAALGSVAATDVRVHCAGRTDAGVHATGQVVHFDSASARSVKAWVMGSNANLPPAIVVRWASVVPLDFHARFSAVSRRYCYLIYNEPVRSAVSAGRLTWVRRPLDVELMHRAAQCLPGEQDFSSFQAASCQSPTSMRCVDKVDVYRHGNLVVIDIQANAFLHHMVRNIAGSLLAVGDGRHSVSWLAEILALKDRTKAAETAPPDGLYLVDVGYPECFSGLGHGSMPAFLQGSRGI